MFKNSPLPTCKVGIFFGGWGVKNNNFYGVFPFVIFFSLFLLKKKKHNRGGALTNATAPWQRVGWL